MNSKFHLLLSKQKEESKYKLSIHKTNLKLKKFLKIISLYFLTYIINIAPSIYQKKISYISTIIPPQKILK